MKYAVSSCLLGVNCKYNGKNNLNNRCLELLREEKAILVCPEQLGGLSTPREPAELIGNTRVVYLLQELVRRYRGSTS